MTEQELIQILKPAVRAACEANEKFVVEIFNAMRDTNESNADVYEKVFKDAVEIVITPFKHGLQVLKSSDTTQ